jgi:hypothetical protein
LAPAQVEQAEHRIGWLARKLRRRASASPWPTTAGATRWGAFVKVSDLASAQQLADRLSRLDHYANSTNNMQKGKEGEKGGIVLLHDFCEVSDRPASLSRNKAKRQEEGGREMRLLEVRRGGSVVRRKNTSMSIHF